MTAEKANAAPSAAVSTVSLGDTAQENVLKCRITVNASNAAKAPLYRVLLTLPGPLGFSTLEFPVFAERNNKANQAEISGFSVAVPGGGFPALTPIKQSAELKDGRIWFSGDVDSEAKAKMDLLLERIKSFALDYHHAPTAEKPKKAQGTIAL